jgi:hypothetical protein
MNRTHVVAIIGTSLFALLIPALSLAQDTGTDVPIFCPALSQTLQFGSRDATTGGQVSQLQHFLSDYYDLNPDDYITGYFGRLTRTNVQKFQCETMNICSGDEASTGWGVVGPRTRAAIAAHCGIQSTTTSTPPPTNPPPANPPPTQPPQNPAPTCSISVSPSSITGGQSALLIWFSTNATAGSISSIGSVGFSGSQSVSPTQTTTYTGTFMGSGGSAQCSTTLILTPQTTTNASCTWNGQTVASGSSVTAYQTPTVAAGLQCVSEQRTCTNGTLSGSFVNATCSVATATCTPDSPQKQTLACPAGQIGSIIQTRTSTCASGATSPTWGAWVTTGNTCITADVSTPGVTFTATPSSGAAPLTVSFLYQYPAGTMGAIGSIDFGDSSPLGYPPGNGHSGGMSHSVSYFLAHCASSRCDYQTRSSTIATGRWMNVISHTMNCSGA